ncbi:MAG: hypothetical protein V4636_19430 [Pseudomonadota bacterium]
MRLRLARRSTLDTQNRLSVTQSSTARANSGENKGKAVRRGIDLLGGRCIHDMTLDPMVKSALMGAFFCVDGVAVA